VSSSDTPRLDVRTVSAPAGTGKAKRGRAVEDLPTLAEARRRLAAWKTKPSALLTPEALDVARDLPELLGPPVYRKPRR
jgi:hypothetical protein